VASGRWFSKTGSGSVIRVSNKIGKIWTQISAEKTDFYSFKVWILEICVHLRPQKLKGEIDGRNEDLFE
jgi:hypothetical protein